MSFKVWYMSITPSIIDMLAPAYRSGLEAEGAEV